MAHRGFAGLAVLIILLGVLAIGGSVLYYKIHNQNVLTNSVVTSVTTSSSAEHLASSTTIASSSVSYSAPATLPRGATTTTTASNVAAPASPVVRTAGVPGWQTYVNTDLGFSIEYPPGMYLTASTTPGSPEQVELYFSATPGRPQGSGGLLGSGNIYTDPNVLGSFAFPLMSAEPPPPTPIKGEILNQTTIDGITAYVHNIDLDALSPGAGSISDIMREIDFTRPNEFISFESILPSGDITTIANESFTIDKIVATLRFFPFPSLGPVGSETLKMDPNEGDYHDLNDNNVYYETGKITSTQMSLTVRNSAQLKFGGQITLPLGQPVTAYGYTFTLFKVQAINKGTAAAPWMVNEATVIIQ